MVNATHVEAVSVLKNIQEMCLVVVSREVLVVMPDEPTGEEGGKCQKRGVPLEYSCSCTCILICNLHTHLSLCRFVTLTFDIHEECVVLSIIIT